MRLGETRSSPRVPHTFAADCTALRPRSASNSGSNPRLSAERAERRQGCPTLLRKRKKKGETVDLAFFCRPTLTAAQTRHDRAQGGALCGGENATECGRDCPQRQQRPASPQLSGRSPPGSRPAGRHAGGKAVPGARQVLGQPASRRSIFASSAGRSLRLLLLLLPIRLGSRPSLDKAAAGANGRRRQPRTSSVRRPHSNHVLRSVFG